MSDGMIGKENVTIPDLLEPVVGFRTFSISGGNPYKPAWIENKAPRPKEPFREPPDYVTDPVSGKLIKDYEKIYHAFMAWKQSMEPQIIHHPAVEAQPACLISPHRSYVWKAGTNEAECTNHDHVAPEKDCQCGLYSYYDVPNEYVSDRQAIAIVTSWGKIEAHTKGMRSQYMNIELLLGGRWAAPIAEEWEIPFIRYVAGGSDAKTLLNKVVSEYGSPLPESMRPKAIPLSHSDPNTLPLPNCTCDKCQRHRKDQIMKIWDRQYKDPFTTHIMSKKNKDRYYKEFLKQVKDKKLDGP